MMDHIVVEMAKVGITVFYDGLRKLVAAQIHRFRDGQAL